MRENENIKSTERLPRKLHDLVLRLNQIEKEAKDIRVELKQLEQGWTCQHCTNLVPRDYYRYEIETVDGKKLSRCCGHCARKNGHKRVSGPFPQNDCGEQTAKD